MPDDRLRAHRDPRGRRPPVALAVGDQDLDRQHGPGRGRRDRQARRAGRPARGRRHGRPSCPTCRRSSRSRATGCSARAAPGALFAVLTIFFFLSSLRSTLVAAVSIPLSLLAALVIMQITGITLNIMTLGGLAVAVGRVVDDAIVVLENIYRHRALGEDRLTASINGPREVAGRDHRGDRHDRRRVPAARLRRRLRQPVLPALRADRHLRAAGLAGVRADGRAGARVPAHQEREVQRRRGRRAQELVLDPRLHAGDHVRPAQPLDEARRGRRVGRAVLRDRR